MKPNSWPEVCDTANLNISQLSDKVKGWIADYKRDEKNAETKRADKKGNFSSSSRWNLQTSILALCSKLEIIKQLQEVIKNADGSISVIDIENWASERKSEIRGEIRKLKAQK